MSLSLFAGPCSPASPTRSFETIFDKRRLLDTLGGDESTMHEVLKMFLDDMPTQINRLEEAVNSGDARRATRQAHTVEGAAASVGAVLLRECSASLEELGRTSQLDEIGVRLNDLRAEFAEVRKVVEKELRI